MPFSILEPSSLPVMVAQMTKTANRTVLRWNDISCVARRGQGGVEGHTSRPQALGANQHTLFSIKERIFKQKFGPKYA